MGRTLQKMWKEMISVQYHQVSPVFATRPIRTRKSVARTQAAQPLLLRLIIMNEKIFVRVRLFMGFLWKSARNSYYVCARLEFHVFMVIFTVAKRFINHFSSHQPTWPL